MCATWEWGLELIAVLADRYDFKMPPELLKAVTERTTSATAL